MRPATNDAPRREPVREEPDELEELSDLPLTPREGWTSLIALALMLVSVGMALDDSLWAGYTVGSRHSQTGFLPIAALFSVLIGAALAKSRLGPVRAHLVGSVAGAAFLLNAVSAAISSAPTIEGRLADLSNSISLFVEEVFVLDSTSSETSIFLLTLGTLLWAAGQFSAFAVFRRHRPLPAIVLPGLILLVNVSLTVRDEYIHLVVFVAAALVLLVRLNLLEQAREWRARGMRDVADVSGTFMRNGAVFVALMIVASTTLAANAASAPLSRVWHSVDDELLEIGYAINRWLGGVSGSARGPNVLFSPNQTIRGLWESSSELVLTATSTDEQGHRLRGATYDSFDGRGWQQRDRFPSVVAPGDLLLGPTTEGNFAREGRHEVLVTVMPADYGGDVLVAPESPLSVDQPAEVLTHGAQGPFVAAELSNGIEQGVPYGVTSYVRDAGGPAALTAARLAGAGTLYPNWVARYTEIRPDSIGDIVGSTARAIVNRLPENRRNDYHVAKAVQDYLYRSGGFAYSTDVRGMCVGEKMVDCFLRIKQGYCEFYATTMVMMLRTLGIPSRYVLGYLPGREQADGSWLVDRSAAHAWVEVYFPGYGWVEFDPTPGNAENGQEPTDLVAGGPIPTQGDGFPGAGELEGEGVFPPEGAEQPEIPPPADVAPPENWTSLIVILLALVTIGVLGAIAAVRRIPRTEPELAYSGVARLATRLGYGPSPSQTAYEFAARLGELVPVARTDLELIATAKVETTYGRRQPAESFLRTLGAAYRRVRLGLLRLVFRRPRLGRRPRVVVR